MRIVGELTASLTDEANSNMDQVSDIVALPHIDDSGVQKGVISSKRKSDDTLTQLLTSKPIQYEVVNKVEEEFDDSGFRELDGYFEGTNLHLLII